MDIRFETDGKDLTKLQIGDSNYCVRVNRRATALRYLVNSKGKRVSRSYQGIKPFSQEDYFALRGNNGNEYRLLKLPERENGFFKQSPVFPLFCIQPKFEKELESGLIIVSFDVDLKYVMDTSTGEFIAGSFEELSQEGEELYSQERRGRKRVRLYRNLLGRCLLSDISLLWDSWRNPGSFVVKRFTA
ncbi:MAG: hypothetical protein ABIH37_01350 [archaeon]